MTDEHKPTVVWAIQNEGSVRVYKNMGNLFTELYRYYNQRPKARCLVSVAVPEEFFRELNLIFDEIVALGQERSARVKDYGAGLNPDFYKWEKSSVADLKRRIKELLEAFDLR